MNILRNCWYMMAWQDELLGGGSLHRTIADEPIVVSSNGSGLAAMSVAGIGRDIAVAAKHRIVWIWLGRAEDANPDTIPDFSCYDDVKDTAFFCGRLHTAANYELLTDNILDLSHADFLHPATLGGGMVTRTPPMVRRAGDALVVTWEATNEVALPVFDRMLPQPGQPAHLKLEVTWHAPATMLLRVQVAPAGEPLDQWFDQHAAHIMTPESRFATNYFYGSRRNYMEDDAAFNAMQARMIGDVFATEDKPIVEAQQRAMGRTDLWDLNPILLTIDAGPVQARRLLQRYIQAEASA